MTLTLAQAVIGSSADNVTSISKAYGSNVAADNRLVIAINKYSPSADAPVVGDISKSAGTSTLGDFTLDKVVTGTTNYFYAAIYSAPVTGSGSCTIQVGGAPANSYFDIGLLEVHSDVGDVVLENINGASAATGAPDSGNVASAGAAIFVGSLTIDIVEATTITPDGAFTTIFEQEDGLNHLGGSSIYRIVSGATTDSASWTAPTTEEYSDALAVYREDIEVVVEQEGFRFGIDDGSESAHTWADAQDTSISTADNLTRLIRALLNTTGDKGATAYKLKFQKNGSGGYSTMAVGTTSPISPPTAPTATVTTVGTAGSPWTINRSTGSSGDVVVFIIAWDDSTAVTSVTAPAGVNGETAVSIAGPIASASTEMRMQAWYYVCTGTWGSGTLSFTPAAAETCRAVSFTIPSGQFNAGDVIGFANTRASAGTAETNVLSPTGTAEADDGNGRLYIAFGSDADALTVPGSDWNTIDNATGGGVGLAVGTRNTLVSNSESITALTATIAGDSWASLCFVVKPNIANNDIYITTSANITAGGEDTTARLTAPSGKTTSDFVTGRRWDDENGTDTIDITTDDYTEVEWCIALKSGLVNGDYFDMRVYAGDIALDTYTVTPRWTVSTGGVVGPLLGGRLVKHGILQGRLVRS